MKIIETPNASNVVEFAFEHSKEYQNIQFAFMDAVESLDHNNIIVRFDLEYTYQNILNYYKIMLF